MSEKSQTIGDSTFLPSIPNLADTWIFARGLYQIFPIVCDWGTGAQQFMGLVMS